MDDSDNDKIYFIVAERIEYNFEIVKYYNNEGKVIKGEANSNWAKEIFSKNE